METQEAIKYFDEIEKIGKKALEELEQYRALGTVEELKEAREKQIPKKVISPICEYRCPICDSLDVEIVSDIGDAYPNNFCPDCGQKLDWD
jgi:hypothetical protein